MAPSHGLQRHIGAVLIPLFLLLIIFHQSHSKASTSVLKNKCHQLAYYTEPKCLNYTDGYGCECGPGFHWNTEMCMSTAIDSRLEFEKKEPIRYTLLLEKAFPELKDFTIVFWIRLYNDSNNKTVFSYKHNRKGNVFRMGIGDSLHFDIWNYEVKTDVRLSVWKWYHVIWTWSSTNGAWDIYINDELRETGQNPQIATDIPSGGHFVLGQSYEYEKSSTESAFLGDLAHVNIWNVILTAKERREVFVSCNFMYCGNVVQWADFRSGTRGAMKLRWPSGVYNYTCFTVVESAGTCNQWCSDEIGAQCNMQIVENIVWRRTPAVTNLTVPCPGQEKLASSNDTYDSATRTCERTTKNQGLWSAAYIDDCISEDLRMIKWDVSYYLSSSVIDERRIQDFCQRLLNHTKQNIYTNPVDVATVIDILDDLIKSQVQAATMETETFTDGKQIFQKTKENFPNVQQTFDFAEVIIGIINELLRPENDKGWNAIRPQGVEGDNLLQTIEAFADVIARSLRHHVTDDAMDVRDGRILVVHDYIEFKIEMQRGRDFLGYLYPDWLDRSEAKVSLKHGSVRVPKNILSGQNHTFTPELILVSSFRFKELAKQLPNHNIRSMTKDDHVNSPVLAVYIHADDMEFLNNLSEPITVSLPFLDNFNISNYECARVVHGFYNRSNISPWYWNRGACNLIYADDDKAECACVVQGVYAIITDMYNINWKSGYKRPILMNIASYLGCSMAALLCLITLIVHIRFRTSSSTASLHRNLAVSIFLSQVIFMVGIDRYDFPLMCRVFAVLLHYFVLCNYAWLMNEAFNQYIVITYSAHSHGELTDSGSMFRYYFLGWIVPAVLVGAFVGSQSNGYYATDMCCTSWDNIWLLIGPTVGFITITIMVLIFTAKEHNENSYTKSEKTNKIILIHMKGLWIQIILVTVAWSFAFLSLIMHDAVIKYLYALMNTLQGAFFVVFFLFLHEEIQVVIKSHQKSKKLSSQACEADDPSMESFLTYNIRETMYQEPTEKVPLTKSTKEVTRRRNVKTTDRGDDNKVESDCEMVTTV